MKYIKQLDSLRAVAVFLVIIWHWIPRNSLIENLHAGPAGVNIFFVLSGFLITKILLDNRYKAENVKRSKTKLLKSFYLRRMLRIFPIYYLTIFFAVVLNRQLNLGLTQNEVLSNLTYTSNFFVYFNRSWPTSSLHFWSLAVEEQFYLAWPLIMLFWPKKLLAPVFFLSIAVGVSSQLLCNDTEFGHLPTNTCLDCFGAGGLLGFIMVFHPKLLKKTYRSLTLLSIAGMVALIMGWQFKYYITCTRFIHTIVSSWIINHILLFRDRKSPLITVLSSKLLIGIGRVSYGIYLYHMLYVYFVGALWYKYVFDYYSPLVSKDLEPWIFLAINFWILYFVALFSWRFIEKPFISLKRKFEYPGTVKEIPVQLSEAS